MVLKRLGSTVRKQSRSGDLAELNRQFAETQQHHDQVFSKLAILSPASEKPKGRKNTTSRSKFSVQRQIPSGRLVFYEPQTRRIPCTPLEQAELAAEPLMTPCSPSMICSSPGSARAGFSWSCLQKVNTTATKDTPDPFLVMATAMAKAGRELPSEELVGQASPEVIEPRCLEFNSTSPAAAEASHEDTDTAKVSAEPTAAAETEEDEQRPGTLPEEPKSKSSALNRLKQRTDQRQSSQIAALNRLKQLTVQKQRNRLAAIQRPQPPAETVISGSSMKENEAEANQVKQESRTAAGTATAALPKTLPPEEKQQSPAPAAKPYLKRRSQSILTMQKDLPDWSAVQSKTQCKLDPNFILRPKPASRPSTTSTSTTKPPAEAAAQSPTKHQPWVGISSHRPTHQSTGASLGRDSGGPLAQGGKNLTVAQRAARSNPFIPPQVTNHGFCSHPTAVNRPSPTCGPLGAGFSTIHMQPSLVSQHSYGTHTSSGYLSVNSGIEGPSPAFRGAAVANDFEDPLRPFVNQVEHLLSSVQNAIPR